MINQASLTALGFWLVAQHRRYDTYLNKDNVHVTAAKYKVGGEYLSSVIIDGQQTEVKTLKELNELLTK